MAEIMVWLEWLCELHRAANEFSPQPLVEDAMTDSTNIATGMDELILHSAGDGAVVSVNLNTLWRI